MTSALHKNFTGTRLRLHTWNHSHSYSGNTMSKAFSFRFTVETTWGRERERMVDSQSDIGNRGTDPVGVQAPNQATTHQPGFMKITGLHNVVLDPLDLIWNSSATSTDSVGIPESTEEPRQTCVSRKVVARDAETPTARFFKTSAGVVKKTHSVNRGSQRRIGTNRKRPSVRNLDRASSSSLWRRVSVPPFFRSQS